MLVLLPASAARQSRRPYLAAVAGIALSCGVLVGAAFMAAAAPPRGVTTSRLPIVGAAPPRDGEGAAATAQFAELTDSLARQVNELTSIPSILPAMGAVSSPFSRSRHHPIYHVTRPHGGIDIAAPSGTPVIAPAAGIVAAVAEQGGYGLMIEVDHGRGVVTRYGHLSRARVGVGQLVTRGQLIANVGSSGLSTGPHLHYEIRLGGAVVDPLLFGP
jgi:Membrane proteins related to metalloendopeptidases